MRIAGEQRRAARRARPRHRPDVGRPAPPRLGERREGRGRARGEVGPVGRRRQAVGSAEGGQRQRALVGVVGVEIGDLLGREQREQARASRLEPRRRGQPQRHQLDQRQGIGGGPGREPVLAEQEELRRAAPERPRVHCPHPGVDARRIGLEKRPSLRRLEGERGARAPRQFERAHRQIDRGRLRAEQLREPPLRRPPRDLHLPEPVLRMRPAQREEGVGVRLGEDVGHGLRVAHDLDRGAHPLRRPGRVVVGRRSRSEVIGQAEPAQRRRRARRQQPDHQPEDQPHRAMSSLGAP